MVGKIKIGEQIRQTHSRFRNIDDFESYINSVDPDCDSDDSFFNGYIYILDTPQFNEVNRSQYGNGCDFKHEIIEYRGNNCYIPSKGYCFEKCIKFFTGDDYKQQYLDFTRNEKRRTNILTKGRSQPFCRDNNINLGYYDGDRVFPRSVTNRNNSLFLNNNQFCFIWKSEGVSFNQDIQELKDNFKMVDNYITEENVKTHFEYIYINQRKQNLTWVILLYMISKHIILIEQDHMYFVFTDWVN